MCVCVCVCVCVGVCVCSESTDEREEILCEMRTLTHIDIYLSLYILQHDYQLR